MPKRILVVDDSPSIRSLIRVFLASHGYELIEADSGERALGVLRILPADVVIVDVNMPGMGGVELVRHMRTHAKAHVRGARVILLSADDDSTARAAGAAVGADAFLSKPVTADGLNHQISQLLHAEPV